MRRRLPDRSLGAAAAVFIRRRLLQPGAHMPRLRAVLGAFAILAVPAAHAQTPRPDTLRTMVNMATMSRGAPDPGSYSREVQDGYARVRKATDKYHQLDAAVADGFAPSVAECYSDSSHGAMGYHH